MYYREIAVDELLSPYVECIWVLETNQQTAEEERIFPDGRAEFILHYRGQTQEFNEQTKSWQPQADVLFAGQRKKWLQIKPSANNGMLGVRFTPFGAAHFLKDSLKETTDKVISMHDWKPGPIRQLQEQIVTSTSMPDRIKHLLTFLHTQFQSASLDWSVFKAIKFMQASAGNICHKSLLAYADVSERQLERRFANTVGIPPKTYTRIIRFQSVLQALEANTYSSLTELAFQHNYADQSHFIKDFKGFTGQSPSEYVSNTHQMNSHMHQSA